jgi:hypothetical protein
MIIESQRDVVEFLSSPANFGGAPVQRIDTHLSHVFLVGARVFKIKRAIRYDFVDFSTLDLRKEACEKEIRINRRTAPGMYLGAVPIYRKDGAIGWKAAGDVVEWAVEMIRFDPGMQFDEMLERGALADFDIERLADQIADFHLKAEVDRSAHSSVKIDELIDQIATSLGNGEIGAGRKRDLVRWTALARDRLETCRKQLDARGRHGRVRRCHGDLHLANICMFQGEPTPFDAIEFNDDIAIIDILYDLAFTLMDFVHHGHDKFANLFLNRYLSATRDYSGLRLMPLFMSLRAAVRAMVLSFPAQPPRARRLAERYFDLATEFLLAENEPRLIAIGGYSGTGKSTLAGQLAVELDHRTCAVVLHSDIVRKRLAGIRPETRLDVEAYSDERTAEVYRRLFRDARRVLRAGQSVIIDATFLSADFRRKAERVAQRAGAPFMGVWLTAPRDILLGRVAGRRGDASDATAAVVLEQLKNECAAKEWRILDASDSPNRTLRHTLGVLCDDDRSI